MTIQQLCRENQIYKLKVIQLTKERQMLECDYNARLKADMAAMLENIRAEIMHLDNDLESVDYDYNDMTQTEEIHMICREEVLQIIDNYMAKSEVEDGNDN